MFQFFIFIIIASYLKDYYIPWNFTIEITGILRRPLSVRPVFVIRGISVTHVSIDMLQTLFASQPVTLIYIW